MEPEAFILNSNFPSMETPKDVTLAEFFYRLDQDPEETFLACLTTGKVYSRGHVIEQAKRFATSLSSRKHLKLQRGDIVAIYLPNVAEYFSILLGFTQNGIIPALLNPNFTPNEIHSFLGEIDAKAFFCLPECVEKLEQFLGKGSVETLITLGAVNGSRHVDYFQLVNTNGSQENSSGKSLENFRGDVETAVIILSSGTTGRPKGVELTHYNVIESTIASALGMDICFGRETMFTQSPLFTIGGLYFRLTVPFYAKCRTISLQRFSSESFVEGIKQYKPTFMFLVPALLSLIAARTDLERADFQNMRTILFGGAVSGSGLLESVRQKIGSEVFLQAEYGMTEHGLVTMVPRHLRAIADATASVGTPLLNTQLKIIDISSGEALGANIKGEICFKGPQCMKGYHRRPEETSKTIDSNGWLHSGDLGYYTPEHRLLYVCGRIKDLIKVNGHQVSPDEIEDVIRRIDSVANVSVFGIPHPKYGEVPKACIVRKTSELSAKVVHDFLQDKLVAYKQLKGGVLFVDELPLSPSGKVLRRQLRDMHSS